MKIKGPIGIAAANIYLHFPCITEDEADDLDEFLEEEHIEYEGATDVVIDLENKVKKQKEVIDKANKKLNNFIDCCKAEKLESCSDYIHHQYWNMFERFNKQIKDILSEVSE